MTDAVVHLENGTNSESEVQCSICLGHIDIKSSWSRPNDCNHIFCYYCFRTWFKHNKTGTCPTCKVRSHQVETFLNGVTRLVTTDNYLAEIAAEKAIEDGNKYPLDSEKQITSTRIHYLRKKLNTRRSLTQFPRKCFCRYKQVMGRNCGCLQRKSSSSEAPIIQEITALDMLRDGIVAGTIKRADLLTHRNFRRILHNPHTIVEKYDIPNSHNPRKVNFTPSKCKNDVESYRKRLIPFLSHELSCVQYTMEGYKFQSRRRMEWVEYIFERTQLYPVHSPNFANDLLRVVGIQSFETLQHELFDFASSNLDMESYFAIVGYRLKNVMPRLNFQVGGLQTRRIPEVVTIEDAAVVNLDDDDVVHVDQDSDEEPRNIPESNYLRDGFVDSGSDIEGIEAKGFYNRPGCRLKSQVFAANSNPRTRNDYLPTHSNIGWLQNTAQDAPRSRSSSTPTGGEDEDVLEEPFAVSSVCDIVLSQTPSTSQCSQPTPPVHKSSSHRDDKEARRTERMDRCTRCIRKIRKETCHSNRLSEEHLRGLRKELQKLQEEISDQLKRRS